MANSDIRNKINIRNITAEESKEIIKRVCINTFEYKDNRKGDKDNISIDYSKFPEYTKQERKMIYINDIIDCRIEFLENSEEEQQLKGLPKISPYIISNYIWLENKEYIIEDLNNGLLKTPLQPEQTFSDDPLRMLRAIRFAAQLQFTIVPETFMAIATHAHRISIVSQERITDELNKIMMCPKPSVGWHLLLTSGLLNRIFPQVADLQGAENIDGMGHKDNFYHTLQVLDNVAAVSDDIWLRWAALLHDIGKPATKQFEPGHGFTFHGHEVVGARMVPKIFNKLKLPQHDKMKWVQKLVLLHLRPISLTKENITDSAVRRLLFDAGEDIDSLMTLCEADITSKNKVKVKRYLQNFEWVRHRMHEVEATDQLRNWQPPVTGELIMQYFSIPPGKQVGIIKDAIREAILDGIIPNEYEAAFLFMQEKGKELALTSRN